MRRVVFLILVVLGASQAEAGFIKKCRNGNCGNGRNATFRQASFQQPSASGGVTATAPAANVTAPTAEEARRLTRGRCQNGDCDR